MSYTNYSTRSLPFPVSYFVDLVRYRHLAWNLVGSDLRSRFRRSHLGILWAVLQPLGFSLIIAVVWSQVFKADSFMTFTVYVYSGMLVWEYFSQCIVIGLDSLMSSRGYLKQARIPFLIFQVRVPLSGLVVMACGMIGLVVLMVAVGQFPPLGLHLLLVPLFMGMLLLLVIPLSIIFSIIGPSFRDARYIIALALQAVFFLSPVMLDRAVLHSPSLSLLQYINPVISLLDLFRNPMLHGLLWSSQDVAIWACWTAGLWAIALWTTVRTGRKIIFAL
ncbi:MAG: ABC transporter permease [Hyphomonadaceae bacterium]|nr:ABC transporter permease [Hyphomonadaceae bacterium]